MAQETGSGDVMTDSGSILRSRLAELAGGALPLDELNPPAKAVAAWTAEVERYRERAQELRLRCREEIRSANRDTIVEKSAQCLRSDLLLEVTHRRKQLDYLLTMPTLMYDKEVMEQSVESWADAAMAVVDGVDAGVFGTVEVLKQAKLNLHNTYRYPMLLNFTAHRGLRIWAHARSLAAVSMDLVSSMEDPSPFLSEIVPCFERVIDALGVVIAAEDQKLKSHELYASITFMRQCVSIIERAAE